MRIYRKLLYLFGFLILILYFCISDDSFTVQNHLWLKCIINQYPMIKINFIKAAIIILGKKFKGCGLFSLISFLFIFLLLFIPGFLNGQIIINDSVSPEDMVEAILGDGIVYDNVTYQGSSIASGIFSNGQTTNLGLESGIFLTSGSGNIIPGPNSSCSSTCNNSCGGDSDLAALVGLPTYDAAILQFDFIPGMETIGFKYVFGSEEYNEFVGSVSNDVCGFFISGPNPNGGYYNNENIALVPGTDIPVSINNVNNGYSTCYTFSTGPCTNCEYYIDNNYGTTLEYDGFTTVLYSLINVVPGQTYHVKLAIADVADVIYDSGVFIKENSVELPAIDIEQSLSPQGISGNMVEGCVGGNVLVRLPDTSYAPVTIYYEIAGTAINGIDYEELTGYITFGAGQDSASFQINTFKDGIVEGDETIELIFVDSLSYSVIYDTLKLTIEDYTDMVSEISPATSICNGQEVQLEVSVSDGFPPYSFLWEPGGLTNDTITVSPDETTIYTVTCSDLCQENISDSCIVIVVPADYAEITSFSFLVENNPFLEEDITGFISEDSVYLLLPSPTGIESLVADFMISDCSIALVNGAVQYSGVSANDFTNPVTYTVITTDNTEKNWTVVVDILTEVPENGGNNITIKPNPANIMIFIKNAEGYKLSLINSLGNKLINKDINSNEFMLNIENFDAGIYYVHLFSDDDFIVRKVIINH